MRNGLIIGSAICMVAVAFLPGLDAAEVTLGPNLKIPPHYSSGSNRCSPGRGYSFTAEAPNYRSTYPKLNLRVFNGEVIGVIFEVPAKMAGNPGTINRKGARQLTMEVMSTTRRQFYFKNPPTAEECKQSKGPYGK